MDFLRSKWGGLLIAAIVGGAVFFLWPRGARTPEDEIKDLVEEMAQSAEDRDLGGVTDGISERFRAANGMGKQEIRQFIAAQVLRGEFVSVIATNLEVTLVDEATADFQGRFIFGRTEGDLQAQLQRGGMSAYRIDGQLEREQDGRWRFVSAKYAPVDATELF